jgi:hypothetical protein
MMIARRSVMPPESVLPVDIALERPCRLLIVGVLLSVTLSVARNPARAAEQMYRFDKPPKILVLRGLCEVFSLGMNDLTKKLAHCGYDVKVTSWTLALAEAKCERGQPLVVIGHSLGGRACAWVSRKLMSCGERVPLIIIVDANLIQSIPPNVDRCLNLYVTNRLGIFHGSPVRAESSETEVINWDISEGKRWLFEGGVDHFDIDATPWVHQIILDEIATSFPKPPPRVESHLARGHRSRPVTLSPRCDSCQQVTPCGCDGCVPSQWILGGRRRSSPMTR